MSGIEVAGLVLGSFPIILNCIEYYRKGFEPLEEWWNFRTSFIEFVYDFEQQQMLYRENLVRLLDPVIADNSSLHSLLRNAKDPRWTDGSLDGLLEQRLAGEHKRFLWIVHKMEKDMQGLKKLLRIDDSILSWTEYQRPFRWHLKRIRISFSRNKHRKVQKLRARNKELRQILGYSERIMPIIRARTTSTPVSRLTEIGRLACGVHNALALEWKCSEQANCSHKAHLVLRSDVSIVELNLFVHIENKLIPASLPVKQDVVVRWRISGISMSGAPADAEHTPKFGRKQLLFMSDQTDPTISASNWLAIRTKQESSLGPSLNERTMTLIGQESVETFGRQAEDIPSSSVIAGDHITSRPIGDLCSFLRNQQMPIFAVIADERGNRFSLSKPYLPGSATLVPSYASLISLARLLDAYHQATIDIPRDRRFQIAAHIASGFLQLQKSPWLSDNLSKHELYFLADSRGLCSDHPYVYKRFDSNNTMNLAPGPNDTTVTPMKVFDKDARTSLATIGVIILELIFGQNIESCNFRHRYNGPDGKPTDQTDINTARAWATRVMGECGAAIDDVVRRCLDCSFGPRPSFEDTQFNEAVYEGVIRPLMDYMKPWSISTS